LLLLLPGAGGRVAAAAPPATDEPRPVIRRAIRAAGGTELRARRPAVHRRFKLRDEATPGGGAPALDITGEVLTQAGGRPVRFAYYAPAGSGLPEKTVLVLNGEKSWRGEDGNVRGFRLADNELLGPARHADRVTSLVPLLEDGRFTLGAFRGGRVDGRPVHGVKVSSKDNPDVLLYFDKANGLLVKSAFRAKQGGKEVLWETTRRDYRDLSGAADERVLKAAGLATDDRALRDLLRRQIPNPTQSAQAHELVRKLADDAFEVREKAETGLVALGPLALPALRKATKAKDLEVARRAGRCLRRIERTAGSSVTAAAVGLLALRRAPGATELLLGVLPGADEALARDIRAALAALALRDGKPDPALLAALDAKEPARRAAAAAALGKDGGAYLKLPGRKLFLRGPLTPTKVLNAVDGEAQRSLEAVEVIYYNLLDDKLFVKP
jgi:hypothetical protein